MNARSQLPILAFSLLGLACATENKPNAGSETVGKAAAPALPIRRTIDSTSASERVLSDTLPTPVAGDDLPVYRAEVDSLLELEEDMSGMCSLGCAVGWDVNASSNLTPEGSNNYGVPMLDDGLPATAWVEGKDGDGVGESITFSFPKKYFEGEGMKDIPFWGFMILNGYHKSQKAWKENGRAKRLRLRHNGNPLFTIELQDAMGAQSINFPSFPLNAGDKVSLEVLEVYPGERYPDMAISELVPMGAH